MGCWLPRVASIYWWAGAADGVLTGLFRAVKPVTVPHLTRTDVAIPVHNTGTGFGGVRTSLLCASHDGWWRAAHIPGSGLGRRRLRSCWDPRARARLSATSSTAPWARRAAPFAPFGLRPYRGAPSQSARTGTMRSLCSGCCPVASRFFFLEGTVYSTALASGELPYVHAADACMHLASA